MSDTEDKEDGFIESCGNVFADMGLEDADELLERARRDHDTRKAMKTARDPRQSNEPSPEQEAEILEVVDQERRNKRAGRYS